MKVKELLSDPNKWTQKEMARRADGAPTTTGSADACKFCLYGAIDKCYPRFKDMMNAQEKLRRAIEEVGYRPDIISFNDDPYRTHDTVMAVLEKADI